MLASVTAAGIPTKASRHVRHVPYRYRLKMPPVCTGVDSMETPGSALSIAPQVTRCTACYYIYYALEGVEGRFGESRNGSVVERLPRVSSRVPPLASPWARMNGYVWITRRTAPLEQHGAAIRVTNFHVMPTPTSQWHAPTHRLLLGSGGEAGKRKNPPVVGSCNEA